MNLSRDGGFAHLKLWNVDTIMYQPVEGQALCSLLCTLVRIGQSLVVMSRGFII